MKMIMSEATKCLWARQSLQKWAIPLQKRYFIQPRFKHSPSHSLMAWHIPLYSILSYYVHSYDILPYIFLSYRFLVNHILFYRFISYPPTVTDPILIHPILNPHTTPSHHSVSHPILFHFFFIWSYSIPSFHITLYPTPLHSSDYVIFSPILS